jgi:hypothetical protein
MAVQGLATPGPAPPEGADRCASFSTLIAFAGEEGMAESAGSVERPSPWNSLEVTKIAVSTSTTVAIFFVGFLLQSQQAELAAKRQKEMSAQAMESAEYSKFLDKRTELWDRMSPLLARTNLLMTREVRTGVNENEVRTLTRQSDELYAAYQLYFSAHFVDAFERYHKMTEDVLGGSAWGDLDHGISDRYKCLRFAAARDLGIKVDRIVASWETVVARPNWAC